MMSVKKNLTVATLAALLAVPAFGATNVSRALHMSSTTAHAAYIPSNYGKSVVPTSSDLNKMNAHSAGYGPGAGGHTAGIPWNSDKVGDQFVTGTYNGHTFEMSPNGGYVSKLDGISNPSLSEVNAALGDGASSSINSNINGTGANSSNDEDTPNQNESTNSTSATQYTSKKSLPQTGESNGASKAMVMGTVALGASASMMALSFAKKHQQEAKMVMPVEPAVNNDGGSHKEDNVDKSTYHMIMSNTFKSINNDLKKF